VAGDVAGAARGRVVVLGAGAWGTAFASTCAEAGEDVVLWAVQQDVADAVTERRRNPRYLGDLPLHERLTATTDPAAALAGAELAVLAVPSHALRAALEGVRPHLPDGVVAVSLVKGLEEATGLRASQVVEEVWGLPPERIAVVSGPNLAAECLARQPSATVVACPDPAVVARVQAACHVPWFRAYSNADPIGVEVGGAVKNPLAIAAGVATGLGYGANTLAALLTRGLAEMTRLVVALGGDALTTSGLAGVGDLVLTATSDRSRNRAFGLAVGRGARPADLLARGTTVEGVRSCRPIAALARRVGVEMPIVDRVVEVVHGGADPRDVARAQMDRPPKPEFDADADAAGEHRR
jgi:glycerol-3-phosphate dehydrogenase (NAD(P)+)